MLKDKFGRKIDYLRVSVIDRCNLSCSYCMPEREYKKIPKEKILSLEEIAEIIRVAALLGITKVRLTGGEPLLRKNIEYLICLISKIKTIKEIALTTNGILLKEKAKALKEAGLSRVNVSLDSVDPLVYKQITGGGNLDRVLQGIDAAKEARLLPVKINCVLLPNIPDKEREKVKEYCLRNNFELQFIKYMNINGNKIESEDSYFAQRPPKCSTCNKIRLTVDGKLYPCLFSSSAVVIKEEPSIKEAILKAVFLKEKEGQKFSFQSMACIGG